MGYAQAEIKTLIAVMIQGKDHQRSLDLVFHDAPVKLRLVKGSGPVHLVGAHGVPTVTWEKMKMMKTKVKRRRKIRSLLPRRLRLKKLSRKRVLPRRVVKSE